MDAKDIIFTYQNLIYSEKLQQYLQILKNRIRAIHIRNDSKGISQSFVLIYFHENFVTCGKSKSNYLSNNSRHDNTTHTPGLSNRN